MHRRGFTEQEVVRAIRTRPWTPTELGRLDCRLDLPYNDSWNGKHYATRQIRPVFVAEPTEIVVVTVSTYCF